MYEWVVSSQDSGSKLLAYLTKQLGTHYSARYLKKAIENNRCLVNARTERFASTLLGSGDRISLLLDDPLSLHSDTQFDASRILFEDQDLLVYDKPVGINCDEKGLQSILRDYNSNVQLVHRLDRDTTGALILAKNSESYQKLLDQFKKAHINKCYRAIVDGILKAKEGVIDNYLGKKKVYAGQTIWGAVNQGGLHAHTEWKKLKTGNVATLLHCFPKTGRTHQIRVHLSEMGHPILGDFQYAKNFQCSYRPKRYLLHAEQISFLHPRTGKLMFIEAQLPEDFITAQNQLFGIINDLGH